MRWSYWFIVLLLLSLAACAQPRLLPPEDLEAKPGTSSVSLSWQDSNTAEEGYRIYREQLARADAVPTGDYTLRAETEADMVSFTDDEVDPDLFYRYRVTAYRGSRESTAADTDTVGPVSPRPVTVPLTLDWQGAGNGEVTSDPPGVNCAPQQGGCSTDLPTDTTVTLKADADSASVFGGWTGDCTGTEPTCTLLMDSAKKVTVTFTQAKRKLSLSKSGDGEGTVKSTTLQGLECGPDCDADSAAFILGNVVTLEAEAAAGSAFRGWDGDCSGTAKTCSVTLDQNRAVTATFRSVPEPVISSFEATTTTVLRGESVQLSWETSPLSDTSLRLEADPGETVSVRGSTSRFVEPQVDTTYTLVARNTSGTARKSVAITVEPAFELSVAVQGNEAGKVIGSGINCGNICASIYAEDTVVTLQAGGATLLKWSGCDDVRGNECDVVLSTNRAVIAQFEAP